MSDPALDTKASLTSDADQTADVQPVVASPVKSIRNGINRVFSILVLAGLFTVMSVFAVLVAPGPLKESRNIIIPRGANVHEIAGILDGNKAIYHPLLFRLGSKLIAYDTLHAGEYQIDAKDSIANIVLMLHAGRSIVHRVTVAEGLTSAEVVKLLNDASALNGDITSIPPEGSLLPETYLYTYGDSRVTLIEHMQKAMRDMVNGLWTTRDPSIPITNSAQAVIMASVVEKETGKTLERPRIAGVFYNRLRQKMRLQSDPTVIYAIVKAKGLLDHNLNHDDLAFPSPINTYATEGLPPQPICNPGRAALEAALHPETNDFLYFVADGTGGHVFSRTLTEHNQNVTRWNKIKNKTP